MLFPGIRPFKVPGWSRRCGLHCWSIACRRLPLHQQREKAEAEDAETGGQVLGRDPEKGGKKFLGRRPPLLPTHLAHWCALVEDGPPPPRQSRGLQGRAGAGRAPGGAGMQGRAHQLECRPAAPERSMNASHQGPFYYTRLVENRPKQLYFMLTAPGTNMNAGTQGPLTTSGLITGISIFVQSHVLSISLNVN